MSDDGDGHGDLIIRLILAGLVLAAGVFLGEVGLVEDSVYMATDAVVEEIEETQAAKPPPPTFGSHFDVGTR